MDAAIDPNLTNQQIPETLPEAALWRHMGSQKWCCTRVVALIIMTSHNKHHGGLHQVLEEWYKKSEQDVSPFCKESDIKEPNIALWWYDI